MARIENSLATFCYTLFLSCFLLSSCFVLNVESSSDKHKLLVWIEENSDVFLMLKHWNDLPLISTAWKRIKMTPQVQEDRQKFLNSVESFFELYVDQKQTRVKNTRLNNNSSNQIPTTNVTSQEALQGVGTQNISLYDADESNATLISQLAETQTTNLLVNASSNSNVTFNYENANRNNCNETSIKTLCNCSRDSEVLFDSIKFLSNYEEEKRWIRSQLLPLNYLFDRLKSLEDRIDELQRTSCTSKKIQIDKVNLTQRSGTNSSTSHEFKIEIDNLESLSKTFSAEFYNLSAMVRSIQESTISASHSLEMLLSHASNFTKTERNSTEDVEYCPDNLDETVSCAEVGSSCYCFSKLQKKWTSAQQYCREHDMFLLSLETENEIQLIGNYIKTSGLPRDFYWTSGSDETTEGQWIWTSTQQNITMENWRSNQPDGGSKENCLYLHTRDEFKWGDWICSLPQYFICEW